MSVYVDNMRAPFTRMILCHMIADTHDELIEMIDRINVNKKWIQRSGTHREHFDICLSKKRLAIEHGAIEITEQELLQKTLNRLHEDEKRKYFGIKS